MSPFEVDQARAQSTACAQQATRILAEGDLRTALLLTDAALTLRRLAEDAIEAWGEAPRRVTA